MNGKPKVKRKTVQCAVCKSLVPKRDAAPYGPVAVCFVCEEELNDRDKETEQYMNDMEDAALRERIGW